MAYASKRSKIGWITCVFPVSVATGPLGTMVQLYLIELNGQALGTIYGGLASAIYNGISIPAAIFWGLTIDRLHKRKGMIALGYALTAVALVSFYFARTTQGTIATFSVISFVSFASATPLNLLIMETEPKSRWAGAFARLAMVSSVGNVIGLLISTIWSDVVPQNLILLFLPMGALAVASTAMSLALINEPAFVFERETVAGRRPSFFSRLLANPVFFVTIPTLSDFKRAFRGIRSTLTRGVPLFYISTILFYVSSGLFNTSFVPAMHLFSLPDQEVFAVILAGMVVQTFSFRFAGRLVGAHNLIGTSVQGLLLRGWSYVGVGVAAIFLAGPLFAIPVLILYPLASGVAFAIYYTSSNTMMFTSVQSKSAGAALGVYSAIVGIAAMGGSFASGFISVFDGYYATFILSGILLLIAVFIVGRLPKPSSPDESALQ
ncbi:MAG TPA: MFS transporter [Nitrososphaerales archaeon]|nr:MFS transporter [Nitrososphaerales archaeon]